MRATASRGADLPFSGRRFLCPTGDGGGIGAVGLQSGARRVAEVKQNREELHLRATRKS